MQLVRPPQLARAREGDGVPPARTAFGRQQVIVAAALVDVRAFRQAERRALEDDAPRADEPALLYRILLHDDACETVAPRPMIPEHVEQVLPPVVVVEQRRVEAAAVKVDGVRPFA